MAPQLTRHLFRPGQLGGFCVRCVYTLEVDFSVFVAGCSGVDGDNVKFLYSYVRLLYIMRLIFAILTIFLLSGCTLHFKAEKLEIESDIPLDYKLSRVDIFNIPVFKE